MSKKSGLMEKVQRFGGAMFTPVLLFSFAGIKVSYQLYLKIKILLETWLTQKECGISSGM